MIQYILRRTPIAFLTFFIITLQFSATSVCAQEARGAITGRVVDVTGAVVREASVKVTDVARGTSVSLRTNSDGIFEALYLLPTTYQIAVEAHGFKRFVQTGITLQMNETRDIAVTLQVGQVTDEVSIVGDAPAIRTSSASTGVDVEQNSIANLPLVHGDPYNLISQSPGVTFARSLRLDRPFEPTHIVGYTVNGTRANRSDLMIDGVVSTARANGNEVIASYVPPTDIIQEFKVQTTTYDSQFGNTEGGVTSISIKSGTNALHGTAYYGKEPGKLAANDFLANYHGQPRPKSFSNRYGATVTGPVILPKLYNGHDKTFFTFGWEGIRDARPRYDSTTPSVPTPAMRNGDFSAFLALPNGSQYQIYNPYTRVPIGAPGSGHYSESAFPGNIIPANLINPVAQNLLQFFSNPTTAGLTGFQSNNVDSSLQEQTKQYDTFTVRVDHSLSPNHKIFGRASWYKRVGFYDDYFHTIATGTLFQFISRQAVIDDVYIFNPTTVLNVKYGYNRFIRAQDMAPGGYGFDLTSVGFPAAYASAIPAGIRRFPRLDINSYQGTGQTNEFRPDDTHSASAILNKIVGTHSLKTGVEFRSYRQNDLFASNDQTGRFNFDNTYTKPTDTSTPTQVALSFADFLLGIPNNGGGVTRAASFAEQSLTWGLFAQDDWKVTPKLTLNLGLRYEFEQPLTERFNKSVTGFDPNYVQAMQAQVQAKYAAAPTPEIPASQFMVLGGLQFAGVNGQSRGLYSTPKKNFMPRIGFAYALNPKTVVSGGYGIFYGFLGQRRGDVVQSGFSQTTSFVQNIDNVSAKAGCPAANLVAGGCISTLSNPFPNGIQDPVGAALGAQTFLGNAIVFFNQHPKTPYMQRWSLGVQRELFGGIVVRADYVGNRGTHIEVTRNLNATPQQYLSTSPLRDDARRLYLTGTVANPFYVPAPGTPLIPANSTIGNTPTISRERLLRPFPEFDTITATTNDGYSWYHSGQLSISKRFSHGYSLQTSYTWSKFMQATELPNQNDPRPVRVISDSDYPQRLSLTSIYELPFGPRHLFLKDAGGVVSRIVGGWQVTGTYVHQTGALISFYTCNPLCNLTTGNLIFNGDPRSILLPESQRTPQQLFRVAGATNPDPTAPGFINNPKLQLDHNVRTFPLRFPFVRGNPMNNVDLSIIKNTAVTERTNIQFRCDLINAFNRPLLPVPSITPGANFGVITSSNQDNYPRRVQVALKFMF